MKTLQATQNLFPLSADEAAESVRNEIASAFERHRRYLDILRQWHDQNAAGGGVRPTLSHEMQKPEVPNPLALQITTGVGKTRAVARLAAKANIGLLILARDHRLASEIQQAVIAAGGQDVMVYRGRTDLQDHPAHCQQIGLASELSQQRRLIQPILCQRCPHGLSTMLNRAQSAGEENQEKVLVLHRKADMRGVDLAVTKPCSWLDHQQQAIETRVVIAAHPSYGPTLARWRSGEHAEPRLVVVDEAAVLAQDFTVQASNVSEWRMRLDDIRREGESQMSTLLEALSAVEDQENGPSARESLQDEINTLEQERQALVIGERFLTALASWMAESIATAGALPGTELRPHEAVIAAAQAVARVNPTQDSAAPWERAVALPFRDEEKIVPMRAAHDLAWAIAHDSAHAVHGTIHATAPTVLGVSLATKQAHVLLLDATLPRSTRAAVTALGGHVVEIAAKQNVRIVQFAERAHLRGWDNHADGEERKARELRRLRLARDILQDEVGEPPGVITHKPLAEVLEKQGLPCGYWWRDEVGTDDFNGRNLLIFGDPMLSPAVLRSNYEADRAVALAAGAAPADWPYWNDGERVQPEVQVTHDTVMRGKIKMPTNPFLLAWTLDHYTGRFHQAIGRVRGARASQTRVVHVYAGFPVDWRGLGVQVEFRQDADEMGPARGKAPGSAAAGKKSHELAVERLAQAFEKLLAEGKRPSRAAAGASPSAYATQRIEALHRALTSLGPEVARWLANLSDARSAWAVAVAQAYLGS